MTVAHGDIATTRSRSLFGGVRAALTMLAAAGLIVAAMLLPVVQSSDATTTGYAIRAHEQQLADLTAKSYDLQAEVARLSSIERIRSEAARLGMVPAPRQAGSISVSAPVTDALRLPRRYLPPPAATAEPVVHGPLWRLLHALSLR